MGQDSLNRDAASKGVAVDSPPRWMRIGIALGLASLIGWLAVAPEPPFFSEWESLSVYGTFGAQQGSVNGLIARFGNIGGLGYSPIELSRLMVGWFNLSPTLWNIRLPSLLFGIGSVILLWTLGRRLFTSQLALGLAALVATAPMFVFYSSELIVIAGSLFAFILFLERLDFFARHPKSVFGWLTFSLSIAFALTLYGPVRIICTATVFLLICWKAFFPRTRRLSERISSVAVLAFAYVSALVVLFVVNPLNGRMLGPQLLFPKLAESALLNGSSIPLSKVFAINGQIILEILSGVGTTYTSTFIEATQIQGRFPLSSLGFFLLALLGAALSVIQMFRPSSEHKVRNLAIVTLLAVTLLPMMTSSVFLLSSDTREVRLATLTDYRLIFSLVPLGLLCTVALEFALKYQRFGVIVAVSVVVFIVSHHSWVVLEQHRSFMERMTASRAGLSSPEKYTQWLDGYALTDRTVGWASHFEQHADLRRWAEQAVTTSLKPGMIIYTPLSCFAEDPLKPRSLGEIPGRASTAVWASAYFADEKPEVNPGFVFVPEVSENRRSLAGKEALWSAILKPGEDRKLDYVDAAAESARVITLNSLPPDVILAFTEMELSVAKQMFGGGSVATVIHAERDCV